MIGLFCLELGACLFCEVSFTMIWEMKRQNISRPFFLLVFKTIGLEKLYFGKGDLSFFLYAIFVGLIPLFVPLLVNGKSKEEINLRRKMFHFAAAGILVPAVLQEKQFIFPLIFCSCFLLGGIETMQQRIPFLERYFTSLKKHGEETIFCAVEFLLGLSFPLWLGNTSKDKLIPLCGVATCIGDAFSSIIGIRFGKKSKKTIEGFLGFLLSCFLFCTVYNVWYYENFVYRSFICGLASLFCAVFEYKTTKRDNSILAVIFCVILKAFI
eukprot:GHVN01040727.1.p1 GENE.GHVN01040727.1~~GHVN01040727.1.p1  ORF type:complete len:268 (+),score=10.34 GHVN01040727.1:146-949(+)